MRVLMFSNDYSPLRGGIATHVKCLARELVRIGLSVHIIVPTRDMPSSLQSQTSRDVVVHRIGYRHSPVLALRAYRITKAALQAYRQLKKKGLKFDLIHQQDVRATKVAASMIARREGLPLIWSYHSSHMWSKYDLKNHLFLKATGFRAEGIITLSRDLLRRAKDRWDSPGTSITYISNGIDPELFNMNTRIPKRLQKLCDGDHTVLFCPSRQVPIKGTRYLSEALRRLFTAQASPKLKVIFLRKPCPGENANSYFEAVRSLLTPWENDQVIYLDYVPLKEMPPLYALSDLVVLPSLNEALNLSMLEAMAMKKPVLASDVGGLSEMLTHKQTGWLVPPGNPRKLKEAILKLVRNTKLRKNLAIAGHRKVTEHFSWQSIARQTAGFYEEILIKTAGQTTDKKKIRKQKEEVRDIGYRY